MSLTSLPPELHLEIGRLVGSSSDLFDFLALSNTCHRLRMLFRPVFFKSIRQNLEDNEETQLLRRLTLAPPHLLVEFWTLYPDEEPKRLYKMLEEMIASNSSEERCIFWRLKLARLERAHRKSPSESHKNEAAASNSTWHNNEGSSNSTCLVEETRARLTKHQFAREAFIKLVCARHSALPQSLINEIVHYDDAWTLSKFLQYGFRISPDSFYPLLSDKPSYQPLIESIIWNAQDVTELLIPLMKNPNEVGNGSNKKAEGKSPIFLLMCRMVDGIYMHFVKSVYRRKLKQVEALVKRGGDIDCKGTPYSILTAFWGFDHSGDATYHQRVQIGHFLFPELFRMGLNPNPRDFLNSEDAMEEEGDKEDTDKNAENTKKQIDDRDTEENSSNSGPNKKENDDGGSQQDGQHLEDSEPEGDKSDQEDYNHLIPRPGLHGLISRIDYLNQLKDSHGLTELFDLWLKAGVDIEAIDPHNGRTALVHITRCYTPAFTYFCCDRCDELSRYMLLEMARMLIEHGANLEAKDRNGFNPVVIAAAGEKKELLEVLLPGQPEMVEKWLIDQAFWDGLGFKKSREEIKRLCEKV